MGDQKKRLFGTDGLRGRVNQYPMLSEIALALGQAITVLFRNGHQSRIVIGKDTRLSGYLIENALSSGICSMGAEAIFLGPIPTPGIAFITRAMRADAGVVISASHNPYQDNGIKFFDAFGFKLPDQMEDRLQELVQSGKLADYRIEAENVGKAYRVEDASGRYIEFLKSSFPKKLSLDGLKIVIDCANGAAYKIAPTVLRELGAEVITLSIEPNGRNINENCGALHPQAMASKVREVGAHLGIALDGDADRLILCDEKGQVIDGDKVIGICAFHYAAQGALAKNTVVGTVLSNLGLELSLKGKGISFIRTKVGDRYIIEEMRKGDYTLGGERSGHIVFLDKTTTGDGMLASLQVLALMLERGLPLSELAKDILILPQVEKNVSIATRKPIEDNEVVSHAISQMRRSLGRTGEIVVRYSGTEPLLRIMAQGEDEAQIAIYVEELAMLVEREMNRQAL